MGSFCYRCSPGHWLHVWLAWVFFHIKITHCYKNQNFFFSVYLFCEHFIKYIKWNGPFVLRNHIEWLSRSSPPEVFLGKGVLKICSKFTGEHPHRNVISIKLCCFIEITLWHGCSPENLLHIFRTPPL